MKDRPLQMRAAACGDTAVRRRPPVRWNVRVLQNVVLFINDRLFTANQDDCIFVVEPPHLVRGHKLAPGLLEVLRERTVPALALA